MLPTPPIMLKVPYSSLYLLFGPLKWAQFIYITFLLWKRPEGRTFAILVYNFFFRWCFLEVWWARLCILRWLTFLWSVWCVLSHLLVALDCIMILFFCRLSKEFRIFELENQVWKRRFELDFLLQILIVFCLLDSQVNFFNHVL